MNAKEISDATLPAVTPAGNDLMLIYDVSEGTTGKATIAGIAPKVAENIDVDNLPSLAALYAGTISIKKNVNIEKTTTTPVSFVDDYIIPESGGYVIQCSINNISAGVVSNSIFVKINNQNLFSISNPSSAAWTVVSDSIFIPLKQGTLVSFVGNFELAGFRYSFSIKKVS